MILLRRLMAALANGPVYCAECGTPNPAGSRFCSECGKMLAPEKG